MSKSNEGVPTAQATEIKDIPLSKLKTAPWNYKLTATPAQREKLKQSVIKDQSAGVMAVRHLGKGVYEVIDGNHRLEVLQELEWQNAVCESFGNISVADAVLISRRRNTQWFESNEVAFGQLLAEEVLKEYTIEDIAVFMEEEAEDLQALVDIHVAEFDWEGDQEEYEQRGNQDGMKDYSFTLDQDTYQRLRNQERAWIEKLKLHAIQKESERRGRVLTHLLELAK